MMGLARYVAPVGSIALLTVIAALPWGLPSQDRFFLPLLPVVAIHYWTLRHDALIPEWFVFLAGLSLDVLTHGPLGYWSLIYLVAYITAVMSAPFALRAGTGVRLALLGLALTIVALTGWAVASIYFFELADWRPYAAGVAFAAAGALVLLPLLRAFDGSRRERDNARLIRGV